MRLRRATCRRTARTRAGAKRGYTVAELMVALAAGLLVASALVGLSKETTTTFHEEARVAAAESAARLALGRLRADLQRAGYMGTGNARFDPWLVHPLNGPNVPADSPVGIRRLAGLRFFPGGSAKDTPLSAAQSPVLRPDAIEISGNLTSTDAYDAEQVAPRGTSGCGGQRIVLDRDTPAVWRVVGAAGRPGGDRHRADALLAAVFQPVPGAAFVVRVVDGTGHAQLVRTCASAAAGFGDGVPFVDLDPSTPVVHAHTGLTGGITGFGRVTINPVQVVRWQIVPAKGSTFGTSNPADDSTQYDLVRQWLDADDAPAGPPEVVAELAVDLKIAFTVDAREPGEPAALRPFAFDDANNALWADDILTASQSVPGPQRVRAVRVRLSTRAAAADRAQGMNAPPLANTDGPPLRYCTSPEGCTEGRPAWARVRTLTADVTLPNQAGMVY